MRIRRRYWFVPTLALLGMLLAIFLWWRGKEAPSGVPPVVPYEPPHLHHSATATSSEISWPTPALPVGAAKRAALQVAPLTEQEIRVRRSEMKLSLSAMYGAEKSFFSEFHRYTTDFNGMGYAPEREVITIKTGFIVPYYPAKLVGNEDPRLMSYDEYYTSERRPSSVAYAPGVENIRLGDLSNLCKMGCTATDTGFELISATNLDADDDLDVWLINHRKELLHVQDDLASP